MMTNQEIFDKVKTHLLTQGKKSKTLGVGCAYRGESGAMCAAGCLISDEHYSSALEHTAVVANARVDLPEGQTKIECCAVLAALELSGVPQACFGLVADLQAIHDSQEPEVWGERLAKLACGRGLRP